MKGLQLFYFGTSFTEHGHYYWDISKEYLQSINPRNYFFPFHPEELNASREHLLPKGAVTFWWTSDYSILRIEGSCKDERGGTKSVFWVKGRYSEKELVKIVTSNAMANRMFEKMPFPVQWPKIDNKIPLQPIFDLHCADCRDNTQHVIVSPHFLRGQTCKGGAEITIGVEESVLIKQMAGEAMVMLLVIDKKEYEKAKN